MALRHARAKTDNSRPQASRECRPASRSHESNLRFPDHAGHGGSPDASRQSRCPGGTALCVGALPHRLVARQQVVPLPFLAGRWRGIHASATYSRSHRPHNIVSCDHCPAYGGDGRRSCAPPHVSPSSFPSSPRRAVARSTAGSAPRRKVAQLRLLQNDNHAAFYDPVQDRLICIGGGRDGSWELPLTGTMTWREVANSPYQPWPVGWWATEYDASTASIYFEALGPGGTIVICRMDPNTGSFEPLWADNPPSAITFMSMVFDPGSSALLRVRGTEPRKLPAARRRVGARPPADAEVVSLDSLRREPQGSDRRRAGYRCGEESAPASGRARQREPGRVGTLSLDDTTWTQLSDIALPGDANPNGMVLDPAGDRVLALHSSGDLWMFSLRTNQWTIAQIPGPRPRGRLFVPLVLDTARHRLLVTSGLSSDESDRPNDAWALSLDGPMRWTNLVSDVTRPSVRTAASGAFDAARNRLLVFGGANTDGRLLSDTWQLDLNATRWSRIEAQGTGPLGRYWQASAYDPVRDQLVVFAGYGAPDTSELFSDLWTLSFAGNACLDGARATGPETTGAGSGQLGSTSRRTTDSSSCSAPLEGAPSMTSGSYGSRRKRCGAR